MTVNEIKSLTKFLSDEEVDKIKQEIKSKEEILKGGNLDEEEMIQVLNTLFAILVIEKTLESEIEGVEDIREELEQELLESYNFYDSYMEKSKKDEKKKKKKRWLLDFLFLSDHIHSKKENIGASNKTINRLQNELNEIKQQRSDQNLREVVNKGDRRKFDRFCDTPYECKNPRHHHDPLMREKMQEHREALKAAREIEKIGVQMVRRSIDERINANQRNKEAVSRRFSLGLDFEPLLRNDLNDSASFDKYSPEKNFDRTQDLKEVLNNKKTR